MARAIWTDTVSFGMVTGARQAVQRRQPQDGALSPALGKTGVRVAQKRVDPSTARRSPTTVVKGYELAPDRYVVIEPAELKALKPTKTKTIEIEDFVDLSQIDLVYYDHPYYLGAGPGGLEALPAARWKRCARRAKWRSRVVIRSKERLVALRPMGEVLGMATMLFSDEVLPPERIDELAEARTIKTTKRELDIAEQLVESLASDFQPDRYKDSYRKQVLEMIERKAQGEEIAVQPPPEELTAPAPDLMSALKASLEAVRAREADGRPGPRKPAAKKTARSAPGAAQKPAGTGKAAPKRAATKKASPARATAKR